MQTVSGIIGIVGLAVLIAGIVYLVKAKKTGASKKQGVIFLCAGILVLFVSGSIAPKPVTPISPASASSSSSTVIVSSSSVSSSENTSSTVQSAATSITLTEIPQAEKDKIKTVVEKSIPEKYKGSFYTTDILTSTAGLPMISTQLDNNAFSKESERIAAAKTLLQSLIGEKALTKVTSFEMSFIADSKLVQFITIEDFSKLTSENIEQNMKFTTVN